MFIQGYAHGDPIEIPLFRPYDKATIWEQSNLIRLAARLNPSVFLWECMALNPSYVDLLQRQWMQDDLATITNTYPDHERRSRPRWIQRRTNDRAFRSSQIGLYFHGTDDASVRDRRNVGT